MRYLTSILAFALSFPLFAADPIVFRNANVISMTSPKVSEKQTVVVRDGKIEAILKAGAALPEDATVIDATGKYLMPGLADMHGHLPPPNAPAGLMEDVLYLYLANGVTTVRTMLGHPGQIYIRDEQKKGFVHSPNLYLAGPAFSAQSVHSPEEVVAMVRAQKKEGWDLLKVYPGLKLAEYEALAKAAKEEGMRFGGHIPEDVGLMRALELGHETFDHLDGFLEYTGGDKGPIDEKKLAVAIKKTKEAGAWVVPTMGLWKILYNGVPLQTLRDYPELKYVPASAVGGWTKMYQQRAGQLKPEQIKQYVENRQKLLCALNEAGVKILMGTDAPQQFTVPGFSLQRELLEMRAAGMSPYEILKSGTVSAGEYFKKQDSFGTIEPGKRADIVLLAANPLADIANASKIEGVMVRGKWYAKADIEKRLLGIAARYAP